METKLKDFKSERIIDKIGGNHKYQYKISILLFFVSLFSDNMISLLPMMSSFPIVSYTDSEGNAYRNVVLTYEICNKYESSIIVNLEKSISNWALDYKFYCSQSKASIISSSFIVGACIGLISISVLTKFAANEKLIKYCQITYCFSYLIIFLNNYAAMVLMTLMHGFCQVSTYVLRNTIMTEITSMESRSKFTTIVFISGFVIALSLPFQYEINNWKLVYFVNGALQTFSVVMMFIVMIENPRNLLTKGDHTQAKENSLKIAAINGRLVEDEKSLDENPDEKLGVYTKLQFEQWYETEVNVSTTNSNSNELSIITTDRDSNIQVSTSINDMQEGNTPTAFTMKFKINFLYLFFMLLFFASMFFINMFELANYANENNFKMTLIIGTFAILIFYIKNSILMNSKIGRKGTIILGISSLILLRLACLIFFQKTTLILYICMVAVINGLPGVIHTFITESLTSQERLRVYSMIYLLVKIGVIIIPPIVKYSSPIALCIIYASLGGAAITATLLTNETNGLALSDK